MNQCCLCGKDSEFLQFADPVRKDQKVCPDCRRDIVDVICRSFGASPSKIIRTTFEKMDIVQLKGMISYLPKD